MDFFQSEINSEILTAIDQTVRAVSWFDIYYPPPPLPFTGEWIGLSDVIDIPFSGLHQKSMDLFSIPLSNTMSAEVVSLANVFSSIQPAVKIGGAVPYSPLLRMCNKAKPNFLIIG